jgi:hypothetical protein
MCTHILVYYIGSNNNNQRRNDSDSNNGDSDNDDRHNDISDCSNDMNDIEIIVNYHKNSSYSNLYRSDHSDFNNDNHRRSFENSGKIMNNYNNSHSSNADNYNNDDDNKASHSHHNDISNHHNNDKMITNNGNNSINNNESSSADKNDIRGAFYVYSDGSDGDNSNCIRNDSGNKCRTSYTNCRLYIIHKLYVLILAFTIVLGFPGGGTLYSHHYPKKRYSKERFLFDFKIFKNVNSEIDNNIILTDSETNFLNWAENEGIKIPKCEIFEFPNNLRGLRAKEGIYLFVILLCCYFSNISFHSH